MSNLRDDFAKLMQNRFSCKKYNGKKIPQDDLNYILEQARLSPSSFGLEPWKILAISNDDKKVELTEFTWGIRDPKLTSHILVVLSRKDLKSSDEYVNYIFKDVKKLPDDIFKNTKDLYYHKFIKDDFKLHSDELLASYAQNQSYIMLGTILLASAAIGVDSCAIEGFDKEKTTEILKNKFGVDTSKFVLSYMITLGYGEKSSHYKKTRRDLKEFVEFID